MADLDSILKQLDFGGSAASTVAFDPKDMVKELVAYGEPEAAEKLTKLDVAAIKKIGALAHKHYSAPGSPMLDTAICMAIVEFLEGTARPLARTRRVYPKKSKK